MNTILMKGMILLKTSSQFINLYSLTLKADNLPIEGYVHQNHQGMCFYLGFISPFTHIQFT